VLHVQASKGIHLVVPRDRIRSSSGIILRTETSVLFIIPWGRHWILGTTDTPWDLDKAHPAASRADIDYLLEHVNAVLETPLTHADVEGVYAGLRPLLSGESDATSKLSREHAVAHPVPGLVVVAGGKYTTYRVMAADVIDRAVRGLGGAARPSRTDELPLLGADGYAAAWRDRHDIARRHGVTAGVVEHLLERYGTMTVHRVRLGPLDVREQLGHLGGPVALLADQPLELAGELVGQRFSVATEASPVHVREHACEPLVHRVRRHRHATIIVRGCGKVPRGAVRSVGHT
jgi:glycerol-3-phosphate dehydrogenase